MIIAANLRFTLPVAILVMLLALLSAHALAQTSLAQDSDREEVHYVGDHEIRVVPTNLNLGVGSAQYAVIVTDPATGEPVSNARVVLVADSQHESNPGWAIATNSPADPAQYNVNLKLDSTGQWAISADVSSPLGADLVDVAVLEVPSVNRHTPGSLVFFGAFAAILLGIAYVWWSARRDYRRKQAARAETDFNA